MRIAALILGLALALGPGMPGMAQTRDETLADIRQELSVLFVQVQRLKRELSTTGGVSVPPAGGSTLQRIDAIEQELQRLTARAEEMEHRIQRIVEDGTRRIADLEFRLVELEGGDVSQLGETTTLGGVDLPTAAPATPPQGDQTAELAVGERADFDAARAALEAGEYATAVDLFTAFSQDYPVSPFAAEAHFLRGEAHWALGETSAAARAYLDSFSGDASGARAPQALVKLGLALDELGQAREACVTLGEVGRRFPETAEAQEAAQAMAGIGCQ
ncbi:tol-pal system protein YbgF [Rhodovulum adriaticum]|uniref:Cell division coordinator CpoB n=1 Tax=Rhodovulum adriaticum TaxID=35804 RepID=A0A4R2NM67_RHOAD|nr:tol-pal system protein YbgF [Rhodovulum adriaticum]MBK1636953.1 tol-pal system protein YbgF [Rhodovulum adriaticum]TCP22753.1 tol-pal system protein YbgF [Rhodovulum adriaticum]